MIKILLYLILSLAVAFIAAGKSRSFIGWLLISIVLTPLLGFILIIVLPEGNAAVDVKNI